MKADFYPIKSKTSDRIYNVRKLPNGEWVCSCPDFIFRSRKVRQDCKHIDEAKNMWKNAIKTTREKQQLLNK